MTSPDILAILSPVVLATVLAAVLAAVIFFDLRQMRIPNALSLILLALFAVSLVLGGMPADIWLRLAAAATVFVLGFIGFALRMIGGGDVKILTALTLFIPFSNLPAMMLSFSGAMILATLAVLIARRLRSGDDSGWAFLQTKKMPMGLPIGATGLASPWILALLG